MPKCRITKLNRFTPCLLVCLLVVLTASRTNATVLPTLSTPSTFGPFQSEFRLEHRFYGPVNDEPINNFFGTTFGANVGLRERVAIMPHLELAASYLYDHREFGFGAKCFSGTSRFPAAGQIEVMLHNAEEVFDGPRSWFGYANASIQEKVIAERLELTQNFFYSQQYEKAGLGVGAALRVLEALAVVGEYIPYLDGAIGNGFTGAYLGGIQLRTYGHTFDLFISNRTELGLHRILSRADDRSAHLGFSIRRRFGD